MLLDNDEVVNVKADKVGLSGVFEPVKVMGPGTSLREQASRARAEIDWWLNVE